MNPAKRRVCADDRVLESLRDHERMLDVALLLEKPENHQIKDDFWKLFVQLGMTNCHRAMKQVHIIQHIATFIHWTDQWSKMRNVCKSWKQAIDSSRVDQVLFEDGQNNYHASQQWEYSLPFLKRFTMV